MATMANSWKAEKMFSDTLSEGDLKTLMEEGVGKVLGVAPVEPTSKLTTTWGNLKTC